jgi:hypothetical protein
MKKKYFGEESVFEHIWNAADEEGLWTGNAETLAREFGVTQDEAYSMLAQLCQRHLIERLFQGKFAIVNWPERVDPGEVGLHWWEIAVLKK